MKIFVKGVNACVQRKTELELYKQYLLANNHELVDNPDDGDVNLLWTCGFRHDVRKNSLKTIEKMQKHDPELIVCGCLPSIDPEAISEIHDGQVFPWKEQWEALPRLFGDGRPDLASFKLPALERSLGYDLEKFKRDHPGTRVTYTDQFIKMYVSEGCNFECSYCAERMAFPPYCSIPVGELADKYESLLRDMAEKKLGDHNSNKIVLWADSLGHYGSDIGSSLPELIEALTSIDQGVQVGLEHLHPHHFLEYFDTLVDYIEKDKIFLFSLPIQSASNRVLDLMKRQYTAEGIDRIFSTLNDLDFRDVETDIIVGFPTETEEDFEKTLDFILRHKVKYTKISGYMETRGMDSAKIKDKVRPEVIAERCLRAKEALEAAGLLFNYDADPRYKEVIDQGFINLF